MASTPRCSAAVSATSDDRPDQRDGGGGRHPSPLSLGWSDYTTTGPRSGTVTLTNTSNPSESFNSSGNTITMTGAVVDNRVVTATTVNFGILRVGQP